LRAKGLRAKGCGKKERQGNHDDGQIESRATTTTTTTTSPTTIHWKPLMTYLRMTPPTIS
jgi:hypothetical protein